jgi:DNA processing protein
MTASPDEAAASAGRPGAAEGVAPVRSAGAPECSASQRQALGRTEAAEAAAEGAAPVGSGGGPDGSAPEQPTVAASTSGRRRSGALDSAPLPPEAYATCLAGLPGMGPARLAAILRVDGPEAAWRRLVAGRGWAEREVDAALGPQSGRLTRHWQRLVAGIDPAREWASLARAGIGVAALGSPAYPPALAGDVEPPGVVFFLGSPEVIRGPRVAIVGTRRCTATGAGVARELGRDLAAAGVAVVSGLAAGIDGAAHRGALADGSTPPIGVAGNGLDVVYPSSNADLWSSVAAAGVVVSEAPPGRPPERWRFPARNRIIAALADLVVVVESHERGGSLHTVDAADARGVDVLVVPGSVRNPAAAGTNALLAEGRQPVTGADEVLVALGLGPAGRRSRAERRPAPVGADRDVLEALGWQPSSLDQVVLRSGRAVTEVAAALGRLQEAGWAHEAGGWFERVAGGGS